MRRGADWKIPEALLDSVHEASDFAPLPFMQLVDLITYFRRGGASADFCTAQGLDAEAEVIEIYAQKPVSLESELGFFPIEETEGRVDFSCAGISYESLFDFFSFQEMIRDLQGNDEPTDLELARQLLGYAMKDA